LSPASNEGILKANPKSKFRNPKFHRRPSGFE